MRRCIRLADTRDRSSFGLPAARERGELPAYASLEAEYSSATFGQLITLQNAAT